MDTTAKAQAAGRFRPMRMQEQVLLRDGVLGQEGAMGDRSAPVLEDEGGREGGQLLPITASSPAWRKVHTD